MSKIAITVALVAFFASGLVTFSLLGGDKMPAFRDSRLIEQSHEAVLTKLRDPDSAKFSDEVVYESQYGNFTICGNVNAKNALGGYVGKRAYIFLGGDVLLGNDTDMAERILKLCREAAAR